MDERIAVITKRVEAVNDYYEIENLVSRYTHYYSLYDGEAITALFADLPDTKAEMTWGVYNGLEGVKRCFAFNNPLFSDRFGREGELHLRPVAVPVITVAGDGLSAKGAWICTGLDSGKAPGGGELLAFWTWLHFGIDLVRTEEGWKIRHLHEYNVMQSPYYSDWVKEPGFDPYEINGTTQEAYFALKDPAVPDAPPSSVFKYDIAGLYPGDRPTPPEACASYDPASAY